MTVFEEHYKPKVETELNRELTEQEYTIAHLKYIQGWHPRRTAEFLQYIPKKVNK